MSNFDDLFDVALEGSPVKEPKPSTSVVQPKPVKSGLDTTNVKPLLEHVVAQPSTSSTSSTTPMTSASTLTTAVAENFMKPPEPKRLKLPTGADRKVTIDALVDKRNLNGVDVVQATQPARVRQPKKKRTENVLNKKYNSGPLSTLKSYIGKRVRIVVKNFIEREGSPCCVTELVLGTRSQAGVRSEIEAELVAMDEHWNVALKNVTELYVRSKKRRVLRAQHVDESHGIPSVLTYKSLDKHYRSSKELCTRELKQLLLMGNNVICIAKVD